MLSFSDSDFDDNDAGDR